MKAIRLTQGKVALVDDEDFDRLNQFKWFALEVPKGKGIWYARRNITLPEKRTAVHMHREVLGLSNQDPDVDHRNRNGLDNQKENLRLATDSQNMANRICFSRCGYKGVTRQPYPKTRPWCARIRVAGKEMYLGFFTTAIDAARAYNKAAVKWHGQYARLNSV